MATKLPRVQFTPSPAVRALLEEVTVLSGQSMSSVVSEMMDEIAPVVQLQIDALKSLAATPERAKEHIQEFAARAIADVSQRSIDFGAFEDARTAEGKKARRRAARAARNP